MLSELAANIRKYRKERKLTQEHLAEVMGVTAGAVYKWESGLSLPELSLIMELADFFDISVDVLLGHRMKNNSLEAIKKRISEYCRVMSPAALTEAETALKKYPHSFEIVFGCATVYLLFGTGLHNEAEVRRALELLEQALILLPQNDNPEISEITIYGDMSTAYMMLGEYDKSVELMKAHNINGIFNDDIGLILSVFRDRPDEAEPFLSAALLDGIGTVTNSVTGLFHVLCSRENYSSALDLLNATLDLLLTMKKDSSPNFLDKTTAMYMILAAHAYLKMNRKKDALLAVKQAYEAALAFDSAPDYGANMMRFIKMPESATLHDSLGATGTESINNLLLIIDNNELSLMWEEVQKKNGK